MASVTRKPTSPYWIACFTDHTGKQRQRSTKETDRKKAQKRAEDFEESYRGRPNEVQARKVLSEIYREVTGEKLHLESTRDYLDNWIKRKTPETKPGTLARYKTAIKKLIDFLGVRAERDLTFVHSRDVLAFRDKVATDLTPSSANTDLKILRIAFGQAWKDGLIPVNVATQVSLLKVVKSADGRRRPFTVDELKKLLAHADEEWSGIILTGFYTGQRLGDVVRLKWHQVDLAQAQIKFLTGKVGRIVLLWLTPTLRAYFSSVRPEKPTGETPVFPKALAMVERSQGDTRRLSGKFYDLMVKAGLTSKRSKKNTGKGHSAKRTTNPLSFHSLRHTTTSMLKNAGVMNTVVMDIVGHEAEAVSWNYTHIEHDVKRAALEKLPDIYELPPAHPANSKKNEP